MSKFLYCSLLFCFLYMNKVINVKCVLFADDLIIDIITKKRNTRTSVIWIMLKPNSQNSAHQHIQNKVPSFALYLKKPKVQLLHSLIAWLRLKLTNTLNLHWIVNSLGKNTTI